MTRRGERIGWTVGGFGGFVWLLLLGSVWIFRGRVFDGVVAVSLFAIGVAALFFLAPWRHPETQYRVLFAPVVALLLLSAALCLWMEGRYEEVSVGWPDFVLLLLLVFPIGTMGKRRWKDGELDGDAREESEKP